MILLRLIAVIIFSTIATSTVFSQDDLDGVFDDPDAKITLNLGTGIIRTLGGTPNIKTELILNGMWSIDVEVGAPLFGYRINFFNLEREIITGIEFNVGVGAYINAFNFLGDGKFYVGLDFEKWAYSSTNLELAEDHGYYEQGASFSSLAAYTYSLDPSYEFTYKRTLTRVAIDLGAEYELRERLSLIMGFHVWFGRKKFEFNNQDSFGVNWSEEESFFVSSRRYTSDIGARYSLSLKYRLL